MNVEGLNGLGHHLFSTSHAAKAGKITIIDSRPRLDQKYHILPLHQLNMNLELLYFDLDIAEPTGDEVALSAIRVPAEFGTAEYDKLIPNV